MTGKLSRGMLALALVTAAVCGDPVAPTLRPPTVKFCPTVVMPTWFAYQNEGQGWVQLPGGTSDFSFEPTARLAVAYATTTPLGSAVTIVYVTAVELNDFQCPFPRGNRQLAGSVKNWQTSDEFVAVAMGPNSRTAAPDNPDFNFSTLPDAPLDLVVEVASTPRRIVIRRNVMANSGTTLPPLDISSSEVKPTSQFTAVLEPADAPRVTPSYYFLTANGTSFHFVDGTSSGAVNQSVPYAMTRRGDVHAVSFLSGVSPEPTRYVANYFREATDRALALGPFLGQPSVSVVGSSQYLRLRMTLGSQTEYPSYVVARYAQSSLTAPNAYVNVLMSSGYLGETPGMWDVSIPDLAGVPGFDAKWMLKPGVATGWTVEASSGAPFWRSTRPQDGQTVRAATRQSTLALQ